VTVVVVCSVPERAWWRSHHKQAQTVDSFSNCCSCSVYQHLCYSTLMHKWWDCSRPACMSIANLSLIHI